MNNRKRYIFWVILVIVHLGSFVYQYSQKNWYLKDSHEYVFAARNVITSSILYSGDLQAPERIDFYTKRPPVYPLLLALGFIITDDILSTILLQHILSLINISLTLKILFFLIPKIQSSDKSSLTSNIYISLTDNRITLILLLLLLLYPAQFIYANLVMTEVLFQTLITGAVYCLLLAWEKNHVKYLTFYTVLIMVSMLTKPVMYLFAIPHIAVITWYFLTWRKKQILILAFLPLLLVYSYQSWNESRTGYFHFSSIQNLSLFQYTTYNLLAQKMGENDATVYADSVLYESLEQPTYREEQELISAFCYQTLKKHIVSYAGMHFKGVLNFFIDPGRFDIYHFAGWNAEESGLLKSFSTEGYSGIWNTLTKQPIGILLLLSMLVGINVLKLIACIVFTFDTAWNIRYRIPLLIFIIYISGLTGTSGASRFAVPVGLIIIAITTLEFLKLHELINIRWRGNNI